MPSSGLPMVANREPTSVARHRATSSLRVGRAFRRRERMSFGPHSVPHYFAPCATSKIRLENYRTPRPVALVIKFAAFDPLRLVSEFDPL